MLHNIPSELRELDQWVVSGPDKVPLNPRTGRKASPTDPTTWGTFEEACVCGYKNVGFVLSPDDPFSIIDLDNKPEDPASEIQLERFEKIIESAQSYTEVSTSGQGVHIIVKGRVPRGIKRDKVEIYSAGRYMICTGDVIRQMPVAERQDLLDALFVEMDSGSKVAPLTEETEILSDEEILDMAGSAANGHKFNQLWEGLWQSDWPSQSEADFALLSMLAFYTRSNAQVRRLFRQSGLGQRPKAKRDAYLDTMLAKMRAKEPQPIDLSQLNLAKYEKENGSGRSVSEKLLGVLETSGHENAEEAEENGDKEQSRLHLPSGLVGELADYIFASAIRPVREYSLAASLGFLAGVAGRAYNISDVGLNLYLIAVGTTGTGKDEMHKSHNRLFKALSRQCLNVNSFAGPGDFASGAGLVSYLSTQPCFVSVIGEVGFLFQALNDPKIKENTRSIYKAFLHAYMMSGRDGVLKTTAYSDSQRNPKLAFSPSLTLLGEGEPDRFYSSLNAEVIQSGLLPRFSIFEYEGERPKRNRNSGFRPPELLENCLAELVNSSLSLQQDHKAMSVLADSSAQKILDDYDLFVDDQHREANSVAKELWNRAHLKALKLAALVAVGQNPFQPVITKDCAEWACELATSDVSKLQSKFDAGEVGAGGEIKQDADLRRALAAWAKMKRAARLTYRINDKLALSSLVPFAYLRKRLQGLRSFSEDRRGASKAVEEALKRLVMDGEIKMLPPTQARAEYATTQPLYLFSHD